MKQQRQNIHLQYQFDNGGGQRGAEIENPVFGLLSSLQEQGSIRHAAIARGRSYRFTWGELKHWENTLGQALVQWTQGKRAALTPFAQRLLWAERQARVRMTPHIEALRAELANVYAQAQGSEHEVLEVFASHDLALPQLQSLAASAAALCTWACASSAARRRCAACAMGAATSPAFTCHAWRAARRCSRGRCGRCSSRDCTS